MPPKPNQPNPKDFPGANVQRSSKGGVTGPWMITYPGEAPFEWVPGMKPRKSEKAVGKEEAPPAKPARKEKPYSKTKEFFKTMGKHGLLPAAGAALTGGLDQPSGEIPKGGLPTDRSPGDMWFHNYIKRPLAKVIGMELDPDPGFKIDPNADPMEPVENAPENVKSAYDALLEKIVERFEDLTTKLPNISEEQLKNFIPYFMPTPEEIDTYAPQLKNVDFGPIEDQARRQFDEQTIPKLAEQFAGAGGLNSTALKGELGRAGSDLETKLASLRSQYGLEQNQQQLKAHELGSKRAGLMGQLGIGAGAQQLDRLRALSGIQGQQNEQQLAERDRLQGLLGLSTNRNTTLEPNAAQQRMKSFGEKNTWDPYKVMEVMGNLAKIGLMI